MNAKNSLPVENALLSVDSVAHHRIKHAGIAAVQAGLFRKLPPYLIVFEIIVGKPAFSPFLVLLILFLILDDILS